MPGKGGFGMDMLQELVERATLARELSYSPYSRFAVGAALRTADGEIFTGANVENVSFGLTVCAERVAVFSAIAAGKTKFTGLAVVTDVPEPVTPCGACRQVLYEFAPDLWVVAANLQGQQRMFRLPELLPAVFDQF
jgi:cytidine deaminase